MSDQHKTRRCLRGVNTTKENRIEQNQIQTVPADISSLGYVLCWDLAARATETGFFYPQFPTNLAFVLADHEQNPTL